MGFSFIYRSNKQEIIPWVPSDWEYTEDDTSVILTNYIGQSNDCLVPSMANNKQVTMYMTSIDASEDRLNSVTFGSNSQYSKNGVVYAIQNSKTIPNGVTHVLKRPPDINSKTYDPELWTLSPKDSNSVFATSFLGAGDMVVPNYVNGKQVFIDSSNFTVSNKRTITSVDFEEGSAIYNNNLSNMFKGYVNMHSVYNIPKSVSNYSSAFESCAKLVNIPDTFEADNLNMYSAFMRCASLVNPPNIIAHNSCNLQLAFCFCSQLSTLPNIPSCTTGSMAAFMRGCNAITSIECTIPAGVSSIESTFADMSNLRSVAIDYIGPSTGYAYANACFKNSTNLSEGYVNIHTKHIWCDPGDGSSTYKTAAKDFYPSIDYLRRITTRFSGEDGTTWAAFYWWLGADYSKVDLIANRIQY